MFFFYKMPWRRCRKIRTSWRIPAKYQSMGAKIPEAASSWGPSGTGKPCSRAVAGRRACRSSAHFRPDFVEMFVGVGASRVRDLFQTRKGGFPAIIFIDEIDAVGRQRGAGLGGGHDEREQTFNQLLVEMDGFETNDSGHASSRPRTAPTCSIRRLLRPGRFDRQIVVDAPDVKGREKILQVHSKDKPMAATSTWRSVAKLTSGFTGADLANLMNEAALLTARRGRRASSRSAR